MWWLIPIAIILLGYSKKEQIKDIFFSLTGKKKEFAKKFYEAWLNTSMKLPWEFLMPQAALESGWGTSDLAKYHNNLFGLQGKGTAGSHIPKESLQYDTSKGYYKKKGISWAKFNNWSEAIEFQIQKMLNPKGYWIDDLKQASSLYDAWYRISTGRIGTKKPAYTTEPGYPDKIASIAKSLNIDVNSKFFIGT